MPLQKKMVRDHRSEMVLRKVPHPAENQSIVLISTIPQRDWHCEPKFLVMNCMKHVPSNIFVNNASNWLVLCNEQLAAWAFILLSSAILHITKIIVIARGNWARIASETFRPIKLFVIGINHTIRIANNPGDIPPPHPGKPWLQQNPPRLRGIAVVWGQKF